MNNRDSTISEDLLCPLCEYNLRGLAGNRCPECGHLVDIDAAIQHKRNTLEFLFEHQKGLAYVPFRQTLVKSLRLSGIWRDVQPAHWINARRMIAYKLLQVIPLLAGMIVVFLLQMGWLVAHQEHQRRLYYEREIAKGSHEQAMFWVEQHLPRQRVGILRDNSISHVAWMKARFHILFLCLIAWPGVLFVSQLLFLRSFSAGNIRVGHLLRCAAYSSDVVLFWPVFYAIAFVLFSLKYFLQDKLGWYSRSEPTVRGVTTTLLVLWIWLTFRMIGSYRHYLRIPRAVPGAIAASLLAGLAIWSILLLIYHEHLWREWGML